MTSSGGNSLKRTVAGIGLAAALLTGLLSSASPAAAEAQANETWDLVWITNSTGFGAAALYAEHIEAELGVDVVVHDLAIGGQQAVDALEHIRGEVPPDWSDLIREAEVIVFHGGPGRSGIKDGLDDCKLPWINPTSDPEPFSVQDLQPFRDVMDDLYETIWELRDDEPVILRSYDLYNYALGLWRLLGSESVCTSNWENFTAVMDAAIGNAGGLNVSLHDVFGGPNHDEDPREKGLISADGVHPSPLGTTTIAQAMADAGFALSHRPSRIVPGNVTVTEGNRRSLIAEVPVALSAPSALPVTVAWETHDHTAQASEDYEPASGSLTFEPGVTELSVSIEIVGDRRHEAEEVVAVAFHDPVNAHIGGFYGLGGVVIQDNDREPAAFALLGHAPEGDDGTSVLEIPVRLSEASGLPVSIDWETHDLTALSASDYVTASGTLTFAPGEQTGSIQVLVTGDREHEQVEAFLVSLRNPVGARIGGLRGIGIGVIFDDDALSG